MRRREGGAGDRPDAQGQFRTGRWTFLHDRRVIETFHDGVSGSSRFHVDHLRIDGRPDGPDLKVTWGIEVSGTIINGGRATISAHQVSEFNAFVRRPRSYRSG